MAAQKDPDRLAESIKSWDIVEIVDLFERHKRVPGSFVTTEDFVRIVTGVAQERDTLRAENERIKGENEQLENANQALGEIIRERRGY